MFLFLKAKEMSVFVFFLAGFRTRNNQLPTIKKDCVNNRRIKDEKKKKSKDKRRMKNGLKKVKKVKKGKKGKGRRMEKQTKKNNNEGLKITSRI